MLEGAVAHHHEPPVLCQQPLQAAFIPSFLQFSQFSPIVSRIPYAGSSLCISLHTLILLANPVFREMFPHLYLIRAKKRRCDPHFVRKKASFSRDVPHFLGSPTVSNFGKSSQNGSCRTPRGSARSAAHRSPQESSRIFRTGVREKQRLGKKTLLNETRIMRTIRRVQEVITIDG